MGIHSTIRLQLYEYIQNELDGQHRTEVEEHLRVCDGCRVELEDLRKALGAYPRPVDDPSSELPPEFWHQLIADVETSVAGEQQLAHSFWTRLVDQFTSLPLFQPRVAIAMAVVFLMILGGVLTRELMSPRATLPPGEASLEPTRVDSIPQSSDANARMSGYLRRSKNLLVGLTNMKPAPSGQLDLATERRASRELAQEARFLRQLPLDERSARLLSDLEKIQIELANLNGAHNTPEVDLIRHGIQRENLLFKVRVTETLYDRASFVQTSYAK